jgi:hypothetical protein
MPIWFRSLACSQIGEAGNPVQFGPGNGRTWAKLTEIPVFQPLRYARRRNRSKMAAFAQDFH